MKNQIAVTGVGLMCPQKSHGIARTHGGFDNECPRVSLMRPNRAKPWLDPAKNLKNGWAGLSFMCPKGAMPLPDPTINQK